MASYFDSSARLLLQLRYISILCKKLKMLVIWEISSEDMIVIDNDNEDEDDEKMVGFMTSHLDDEMDSFRDSLTSLI